MSNSPIEEIIQAGTEFYQDPENENIVAVKAKSRPTGKITVGTVNHGVLEATRTESYMPVEPVELEKVYHTIPSHIKFKYRKGIGEKKEMIDAREEMLDRMEALKVKKKRLQQLAAARAAKGATKHGI
jgi:hypothetical protein